MPLFFIVGGFFLKPISNDLHKIIPTWWAFFKKRIWPLLIGYFVLGAFFILAYHFIYDKQWWYTRGYFLRLLWGGRTLNLYVTNSWFIEVFILSLIVTTFVITYVKSVRLQYILAFLSLIVGMSYTHITIWKHFNFYATPWDFDITFLAFFFMFMGREFFRHARQLIEKWYVVLGSMAIGAFLLYMEHLDKFHFAFFMKSHSINARPANATTWVAIVPFLMVAGVFGVSYYVSKWIPFTGGLLAIIGEHSLVIMYWHRFIFDIMDRIGWTSWQWQVVAGVLLPVIVMVLYQAIKQKIQGNKSSRNFSSSKD